MKALNRTIVIFVFVNLLMASQILAQQASEKQEQLDVIQRQAEQAQRQAELAKKQAELVKKQSEIGTYISPPSIPFANTWASQSSGSGTVLVIPSAEIKTQDILAVNEDMNVMSRIFENNLQSAHIAPTGSSLFTSSGDVWLTLLRRDKDAIQSIYLQDYGALF